MIASREPFNPLDIGDGRAVSETKHKRTTAAISQLNQRAQSENQVSQKTSSVNGVRELGDPDHGELD